MVRMNRRSGVGSIKWGRQPDDRFCGHDVLIQGLPNHNAEIWSKAAYFSTRYCESIKVPR